jgi:heme-degrading monooxygenase HmoA
MSRFSPLPEPPYWAVIFSNQSSDDAEGYDEMAQAMVQLASQQPGYLGVESTRDDQGFGITVSYWRDKEALLNWKQVSKHLLAQELGKEKWYDHYITRIAKVERAYSGPEGR